MNKKYMKTMITAHAGSENTQPNTRESIAAMLTYGADAIEIDVRNQGGVPVLSHNELESGAQYMTLESCFRMTAACEGMKVNADIKEAGFLAQIDGIAQRTGMAGRYLVTGEVSEADLAYAREHGIEIWYNQSHFGEEVKDPVHAVLEKGLEVLNLNYEQVTDAMLKKDAERLSIWTVADEALMEKYIRAGVKNVTTRSPLRALELRREITQG